MKSDHEEKEIFNDMKLSLSGEVGGSHLGKADKSAPLCLQRQLPLCNEKWISIQID